MKMRIVVGALATLVLFESAGELSASPAPQGAVCCSSSTQCPVNQVCCAPLTGIDCDEINIGYCRVTCLPGGGN